MAEITKYNVYLNEHQQHKIDLLAFTKGCEPEEIVNNAIYSYLAIVDPLAEDKEPPEDQTEILFYISDADAAALDDLRQLHGISYLDNDEYAKLLLLTDLHPEQKQREVEAEIIKSRTEL